MSTFLTLGELASDGVLRVAYNLNNAALVRRDGAGFAGVAPRLAQAICDAAGLRLQAVALANARELVAAVETEWDIGFLAADPDRCDRIAFSEPYHRVEATFMLRETTSGSRCADLLQAGNTVISARGAAYHSKLAALIDADKLCVAESPAQAHQRFVGGEADALAGVRETLEGLQTSYNRVLEDYFGRIDQAVGVSVGARYCLPFINAVLRQQRDTAAALSGCQKSIAGS